MKRMSIGDGVKCWKHGNNDNNPSYRKTELITDISPCFQGQRLSGELAYVLESGERYYVQPALASGLCHNVGNNAFWITA